MKVLLGCIFVIFANTFQLIDTCIRYNDRPYYISKKIEDKSEIYNAVNEYNRFSYFYPALLETTDKEKPHIRIQHSDGSMGATYMNAVTNSGGYFELDKTVINFNKRATGNTLQCIILHEILHTQMIYHNQIEGSIMNYTVKITQNGDIIQDTAPCKLNVDDIVSLIYIKK